MISKILVLLLLVCSFSSNAYEQQYQIGDTGENGGTVISVVVEEELTDTITEIVGDFLETTEVYTFTERVVELVEEVTYETITTTTEIQTDNLIDTYTDTNINVVGNNYGMPGAEITTGNESQGGGSRVYDIDLDYNDIQEIEYGSTVYSHISNQTVPLCANTTGDCKDDFKITVRLYEDQVLKEQYTHNYTGISWVGSQDYNFTQDVSNISFNAAELELYGIDRGYYNNFYGPGFSDIYFNATYNQINQIINEIIRKIEYSFFLKTEKYIYKSDYIAPPPQEIIEIEIENVPEVMVLEIDTLTEEFKLEMDVVEDIKEIEVMEVKEIEQEIETEIMEEIQSNSEDVESDDMETKEETKQEIANKLMSQQKDKMSAQSQQMQLSLMVILSDIKFEDYVSKQIKDGEFYKDIGLRDQNVIIDYQAGILGYMDYGTMNEMVESQWK
jgi:hypothetical protein